MTCQNCIHWDSCEFSDFKYYPDEETIKKICSVFVNKDSFMEVVRCNNCKYGSYFEPYNKYICKKIISNPMFKADFFCADGERKEKDK